MGSPRARSRSRSPVREQRRRSPSPRRYERRRSPSPSRYDRRRSPSPRRRRDEDRPRRAGGGFKWKGEDRRDRRDRPRSPRPEKRRRSRSPRPEKKKTAPATGPAPSGEPMIIVNVNDRLGTKAAIPCLASDPIKLFKAQVAMRIGRRPHEILLKRQGERPFKDHLTLEDYGVSNGVQLDLELDTGD
ncbi:ubiquitin-like protein [Xylona heveae TC161]|uniref:Ubiquitin-like modifier HUB1 n=1 Tax=Xylona heveae (strain CBS 132557 / TC161) TaxID=1328760 RepID=A0A165IRE7_XYLHT|nr:ubiquitin-like protein [Xylona heveae TC161]KZF25275.1 ubiquitin-like protein [Xylona heveae TC161]